MFSTNRIGASLSLSTLVLMAGAINVSAAPSQQAMAPILVKVVKVPTFGQILVNGKDQALYYWDSEKDGKVRCTGKCAAAWPPSALPKGLMAPASIKGVMGKFTVVMRPDGVHQMAFNKRPLYTFVQDKKKLQVLCDGVDGWHVVRVMAAMH